MPTCRPASRPNFSGFVARWMAVCPALCFAVATALATPEGADKPATPAAPAAEPSARDKLAAELVKDVQAPAGFATTIYATPFEANYPVFVAATCDGTLYVSSDGNGSLGRDPRRGRVLRLRDTSGDGVADESQTFVPDLDSPRGLVFVDDRLIVLHPPDISAFRDTDGDGVAEERTTLVKGIAFDYSKRPADHTSNGLSLGVDGWIYAAIGDFGFMEAKGSDGRKLQLRGGGIVRFRPDGSGLDLFARGTRNNLEAAVSPLLDMITRDNTNDGGGWNVRLHAFTGLEDHGYPRRYMHFADEIVAPLADYGGGSGCGACWIDEPWMPGKWNSAAFTCDWGTGKVLRHAITPKGAGYEAGQEEFLRLTRATDLDVDGVGHVYAASWRGGEFKWGGPLIGFIARITPEGVTPVALPDFAKASAAELVAVLAGPSLKRRLEAQRSLLSRGLVGEAAGALEALAADAAASPAGRVAAIFTLTLGRKAEAVPVIVKLAADQAVSAWAVRALGDLAAEGIAVPRDTLAATLASSDARTRKEAVVALVRAGDGGDAGKILPLVSDADPVVAHTAVEGLVRLAATKEADVIAACAAALDASGTVPVVHRGAARILGEIHTETAVDAVIPRLAAATDAARRADLAWAAARLWRRESAWKGDSWGTRPDTTGPYYAPEEWSASPRLRDALVAALRAAPAEELAGLAKTAGQHRLPASSVLPVLLGRMGQDKTAIQPLVKLFDMANAVPPDDVLPDLAAAAAAGNSPHDDRLAAIKLLSRSTSPQAFRPLFNAVAAFMESGAAGDKLDAARQAVCQKAAGIDDLVCLTDLAEAGPGQRTLVDDAVVSIAGSGQAKASVRNAAVARLAADWAADPARRLALVEASVRAGSKVLATKLVAAADQADDAALQAAADAALGRLGIDAAKVREITADAGPAVGQRGVDDVLGAVEGRHGDLAIGAELFAAKKCVACHATGADGTGLGPSLANAAGIYNRRQLAESVLLPNKTIAQGFATTALVLEDGRQITGFVTSEAADSLALRDAQGVEHRVEKKAIEERSKLATSVMPEGLVSDLTVAQFASLLDFIEAMKQK